MSETDWHTFADGHGCYDSLDRILAFIAVLAVEIDAELIVFAFARCSYAHGRSGVGVPVVYKEVRLSR